MRKYVAAENSLLHVVVIGNFSETIAAYLFNYLSRGKKPHEHWALIFADIFTAMERKRAALLFLLSYANERP